MAKTTKQTTRTAPAVRESVEKVWLAGLGALALAEDEGNRLFKSLVRRGEGFERRSRARLRDTVSDARKRVESASTATTKRVEARLDDSVTSVLSRIGVPTRKDLANLSRRVEALTHAVEKKRAAAPRKRAARRTAAPPTTTTLVS